MRLMLETAAHITVTLVLIGLALAVAVLSASAIMHGPEAVRCSDLDSRHAVMRSFESGNSVLDGDGDGIPCESVR